MSILIEDNYNEEWYQPELHCDECNCTFMYSAYPNFPPYPRFCPLCGVSFTKLKHKTETYKIDELNQ